MCDPLADCSDAVLATVPIRRSFGPRCKSRYRDRVRQNATSTSRRNIGHNRRDAIMHQEAIAMHSYNAHVSAYRQWLRRLNAMWGYRTC